MSCSTSSATTVAPRAGWAGGRPRRRGRLTTIAAALAAGAVGLTASALVAAPAEAQIEASGVACQAYVSAFDGSIVTVCTGGGQMSVGFIPGRLGASPGKDRGGSGGSTGTDGGTRTDGGTAAKCSTRCSGVK